MELSPWSSTSLLCPYWGRSYYNPDYRRQFTSDKTGNLEMHQEDELHPQNANSIPSGGGSHPSLYIYLIIFWSGSFMLNMNTIFEHWAVTLLGCLLVDKAWKSNLLSWACLRIYSAERGGVERQATSFYLSPIPACFLRNEMEREGQAKEDTHPHTHTQLARTTQGNDSVSLSPSLYSCPLF